jgi:hypothetical protein
MMIFLAQLRTVLRKRAEWSPIARLEATGVDRLLAELTLRALEANLKRFQNHSDWIERRELNPPKPSRVSTELVASR